MLGGHASIIGAWKLLSFEVRNSNGEVTHPFGEDPDGSIIYTESGRFSAQLFRPGRPEFASGDQTQGTDEEIKANYEGFISYFGSYELDPANSFVIHHVEGSLFPNWQGQPQKRFLELQGSRLTLSTPPTVWGGGEIVAVLVWERVAAST